MSNQRESEEATQLLSVASSGSGLSPRLLRAPGGFLWWYLDLVDDTGDGLVVIWSFGLPFLPGYTEAARRGRPQMPKSRPSINVATYRQRKLDFYLLQEFDPTDVEWNRTDSGDRWRFGRSILASEVSGQTRQLALALWLEVPRFDEPAIVEVDAEGPGCRLVEETHDPTRRNGVLRTGHDWVPLLCASDAGAMLSVGDERSEWTGRLYHDRNGGSVPLHELGIDRWLWGRIAMPDRDVIYYVLDAKSGGGQSLVMTVDSDGRMTMREEISIERPPSCTTIAGLDWWPSCDLRRDQKPDLSVEHGDVVDQGPFYLRSLSTARDRDGKLHRGVAEVCDPDRVDLWHHRPLVKMRVDRPGAANSMWLPLFSGPRRGRLRRMLRSLWPGRGER